MRTRDDALVYQETQSSDKTTKVWDLNYLDPLSALYLEFEATNEATNVNNFISDIITKIEIVEGSTPLYSLTEQELEALHFYKRKKPPVLFPSSWAAGTQRHGVLMMFGRNLWDTEYALDCKAYKNPQLKITWDLGAVNAIGSTTSFAEGTLKISAIAKLMEEIGAPGKFLSAREVDTFTMPTSGTHSTEMYTDYMWRLMMLRSYVSGSDPDECIDYIKLNCDAGKFIPLDNRYLKQLDAEALEMFGEMRFRHDILTATSLSIRGLLQKETRFDFKPSITSEFTVFTHPVQFSGLVTMDFETPAGGTAGIRRLWGEEFGHSLHATVPIPFGDMDKPETWFDATRYGRIDLSCHAGGSAGVSSVVLEQVRPNGE